MDTRRVATRGIIFKDGKLFAQQLKHAAGEHDFWCTPGGGLDIGESLHDGLMREMIEETGIAPKIGRLLFVQQFSDDGKKEQLEFFFHIENADDYREIDLAATSHGLLEVARCAFIDPKTERVLPAFLQQLDIEQFIASGAETFIYTELS